jgi:DNA-binding response OmpR family regulator
VKILLGEDSRNIRLENERALGHAGYEVICARDGKEAPHCAREQHPDLILLDLLLPKMTGIEVLTHLKGQPATADIPVVVVSGLSDKNRQKLIEAGADDYLEKGTSMPCKGTNLVPQLLVDVICRINRKRGVAFSRVPTGEHE